MALTNPDKPSLNDVVRDIVTHTRENLQYLDAAPRLDSKLIAFQRAWTDVSGDVSYTGAGFQPQVIIFFGAANVSNIPLQWSICYQGASILVRVSSGESFVDTSNCCYGYLPSGVSQTATLKTLDADGFTLTWTQAGTSAIFDYRWKALCLRRA